MAAVDGKHQVIISTQAVGSIHGGAYLEAILDRAKQALPHRITKETAVLADSGYFSEKNCKLLFETGQKRMIPDPHFRLRDERYCRDKNGRLPYLPSEKRMSQKNSKNRNIFIVRIPKPQTFSDKVKKLIDSTEGRSLYSRRMGIVEPAFGNITANKGLNRFNYRGNSKVNGIWQLFCMVHNIEKIHNFGKA